IATIGDRKRNAVFLIQERGCALAFERESRALQSQNRVRGSIQRILGRVPAGLCGESFPTRPPEERHGREDKNTSPAGSSHSGRWLDASWPETDGSSIL